MFKLYSIGLMLVLMTSLSFGATSTENSKVIDLCSRIHELQTKQFDIKDSKYRGQMGLYQLYDFLYTSRFEAESTYADNLREMTLKMRKLIGLNRSYLIESGFTNLPRVVDPLTNELAVNEIRKIEPKIANCWLSVCKQEGYLQEIRVLSVILAVQNTVNGKIICSPWTDNKTEDLNRLPE